MCSACKVQSSTAFASRIMFHSSIKTRINYDNAIMSLIITFGWVVYETNNHRFAYKSDECVTNTPHVTFLQLFIMQLSPKLTIVPLVSVLSCVSYR